LYFPFVDASLNGMETTLMLATLFGSLALFERGRTGAGLVVAALCALTRPEGVLFFGAASVERFLRARGRFPWPAFAVACGLGAAWATFALHTYGTVLPQSMLAKSALAWRGYRPVADNPFEMHVFLSLSITDTVFHALGARMRLAMSIAAA